MDDIDVLAEQPRGFKFFPAIRRAGRAATLVHGGNQAQLSGHGKVMQRHLQR